MPMIRRSLLALLVLCGVATAESASAQMLRVRGDVVALSGDVLTVKARNGDTLTLALDDKTAINAVVPAKLSDIGLGTFVGTAAVPGKGGVLVALEVHIFPTSMRGMGEGHRPFDLQPESTMTNGTVGDVSSSAGNVLTVGYKGGQQKVMVPEDAPVVALQPGDRSLLTPGAHLIAFWSKSAATAPTLARALVGQNGLVPPM